MIQTESEPRWNISEARWEEIICALDQALKIVSMVLR